MVEILARLLKENLGNKDRMGDVAKFLRFYYPTEGKVISIDFEKAKSRGTNSALACFLYQAKLNAETRGLSRRQFGRLAAVGAKLMMGPNAVVEAVARLM